MGKEGVRRSIDPDFIDQKAQASNVPAPTEEFCQGRVHSHPFEVGITECESNEFHC